MLATIGIVAAGKGGFPAYGTLIYSSCLATSGNDNNGNYWSGAWTLHTVYADGMGGSYSSDNDNTGGCYYPSGYIQVKIETPSYLNWTNSYSGASGTYAYIIAYHYETADGNGGVSIFDTGVQQSYGAIIDSYYDSMSGFTYVVAYDGNMGYFEYSY